MKLISSIIFTLLIQFSFAQDVPMQNKDRILSALKKVAQNTKSIHSDFIQTKTLSYLQEPIITSGKFYSQAENMRWEQTKPYTFIMLISDEGLKIKDEDKEKKFGGMAEKFIGQIRKVLQTSIDADFESNEELSPSYFENNDFYKIILTPESRQMKKMYKNIELSFDKTSFRLKMLTFVEEEGRSEMKFMNEKIQRRLKNYFIYKFLNITTMLNNHFFSIENKEKVEESTVFTVKMHKDHKVYDGHFPTQPVAPGVCLAQMVKEICETELGFDLKMLETRNMKFMAVLNPFESEIVSVDLKIKAENDIYIVRAHCKNDEKSFFKIDAKYSK